MFFLIHWIGFLPRLVQPFPPPQVYIVGIVYSTEYGTLEVENGEDRRSAFCSSVAGGSRGRHLVAGDMCPFVVGDGLIVVVCVAYHCIQCCRRLGRYIFYSTYILCTVCTAGRSIHSLSNSPVGQG